MDYINRPADTQQTTESRQGALYSLYIQENREAENRIEKKRKAEKHKNKREKALRQKGVLSLSHTEKTLLSALEQKLDSALS